jgi:hypothetical protein
MLAKYEPVKLSVATSIDNKHRPLFLPDRALKTPIGDLLSNYFVSTPYKNFLCLACLEEDPERFQSPALDKPSKPATPAKAKRDWKIKLAGNRYVLYSKNVTSLLTSILFIEGIER